MTDDQLLQAFVAHGDEQAFRQIVGRYVNLVYAAARRQLRDEHLVDDVTQAVFVLLSRKAPSVRGGGAALAGWLVNAARLTAQAAARGEQRRRRRETQAAAEIATSTMSSTALASRHDDLDFARFDDELDGALGRLAAADRTAVTLRFLQGRSNADVAATMGMSEEAARKRISRAIAKLREYFQRRGMVVPAAGLTEAMLRHSQIAAPVDVANAAMTSVLAPTQAAAVLAQAAVTAM